MTTEEKLKKAEQLLQEVRAEMMQKENAVETWEDNLNQIYFDFYYLDNDGKIMQDSYGDYCRAHHYKDKTFAKARKWQEEARKVAMSFEGYREVGEGWLVYICTDLKLQEFCITYDSVSLASVAIFESKQVAEKFIDYCKSQGKIDENDKIVLE